MGHGHLPAYVDADALLEHQHQIAKAKMKLMREFVEGHTMTIYGEPSPALAKAMEAMGVTFTQFSLFQGLDAEILVRDELGICQAIAPDVRAERAVCRTRLLISTPLAASPFTARLGLPPCRR